MNTDESHRELTAELQLSIDDAIHRAATRAEHLRLIRIQHLVDLLVRSSVGSV
jgi:hypothetical protein